MSTPNRSRLEQDFFENSDSSRFTRGQILVIFLYPIGYRAIIAIGGIFIGYQVSKVSLIVGYLTIGLGLFLFVTKICPGIVDLLWGVPKLAKGTVYKERIQIRGPMHYFIDIAGLRLESRKEDWLDIDNGEQYEVYYARWSRWLLSCHRMTIP